MTKKPLAFVHPRQVTAAFGSDGDHPAAPARLLAFELEFNYRDDAAPKRGWLHVGYLGEDGSEVELFADDRRRLGEVLRRDDLTYLDGAVLLFVNEHHGVMGVATGPPTAPGRIHAPTAASLEDGRVVEALGGADDIAWQIFAITPAESSDEPPPQSADHVAAPDTPDGFVLVARIGDQRHAFGPMPRVGAVLLAQVFPRACQSLAADHPELDYDVETIPLYDGNASAMDILATFNLGEAPTGT